MLKRLTILCISVFLLAGILGCEAKTRYHVLCFLFDGVPTPPGMVPCDGNKRPGGGSPLASKSNGNEVASVYTQHGPYAARLCEGCHQRQTNRLLLPKEDLCLNCHVLSIKKRKVHGPVAAGGCTVCHDPHGSGNKYLLVAKSQEFCLYCHQREDILKNDVHKGTDKTGCTVCHNAHASDNDYLLRDTPGIEASPKREKHEASPQREKHEASPKREKHEASPQREKHEASPQREQHEASPQKPEQKPPQQFAQTAKAPKVPVTKNDVETNNGKQNSGQEDAIKSGQIVDAKAF